MYTVHIVASQAHETGTLNEGLGFIKLLFNLIGYRPNQNCMYCITGLKETRLTIIIRT